jgi:hypothetical protein
MRPRLLFVIVAGLSVGAGEPPIGVGDVRIEIPPGSTWVAVQGWKGTARGVKGAVTFLDDDRVLIIYKAETAPAWDSIQCGSARWGVPPAAFDD